MYIRIIKRILDFFFSAILLALCSPLFLVLSIRIKKDSPGPVFFKQIRIGKDGTKFSIYKFRTMRSDTPKDVPTNQLQNPDHYITRSGNMLRKTSLDELPQLINIFRGEMSFVGPRPALWNQEDLIALREESGVNVIRPGITGLAQVSGRDELPIPVKAKYDAEYVQNIGFLYDCKMLIRTVTAVLSQKGVKEGADE